MRSSRQEGSHNPMNAKAILSSRRATATLEGIGFRVRCYSQPPSSPAPFLFVFVLFSTALITYFCSYLLTLFLELEVRNDLFCAFAVNCKMRSRACSYYHVFGELSAP